ncbi:crystallin J1 [Neolewinella aurantiaca]|uniref:Crystallin J1 n=1 Tax=Neolewinella aurantiaca TaxID=2602767 RepID=A0A5C7FZ59_9BACT|nr:ADP-ribosylglycohydrolase family protein [Neolewinella aurantiaca]TXF90560.1 crystallin J1 [Neolewinella aurantiaca]
MNPITTALLGLSVADAIGVPVEFQTRSELDKNPVTDIRGYGTYYQPPGYFSDDSSLAFGLAESLATGSFDLVDQSKRLINYKHHGYWTPNDEIFDIGMTTSRAIDHLGNLFRNNKTSELSTLHQSAKESDNGNGALMRIFPLYAYLRDKPVAEWIAPIWQHSALTHGHIRSVCCCFLYLRFCHHIVTAEKKEKALELARRELLDFLMAANLPLEELDTLATLIKADFARVARTQVRGSGYVVQSLEAALWSIFNADNYRDTVLNAVNLGEDTDTTACIAGAPAALLYGVESIPANWLEALARREEIIDLGDRLNATYPTPNVR